MVPYYPGRPDALHNDRPRHVFIRISSSATGGKHAWSQVNETATTFPDDAAPGFGLAGSLDFLPAYEVNGQRAAVGTKVVAWLSNSQDYYLFSLNGAGGDGGGLGGCAALLGLETTACIVYTVQSASGKCSGVSTTQTGAMAWNGSGWESADEFVTPVLTGKLLYTVVAGVPTLTLDGSYTFALGGCSSGCLDFLGFGSDLCDDEPADDDCGDNTFVVQLCCSPCVNPDYAGPGYYCVAPSPGNDCGAGGLYCMNFASDPGPAVKLCSGPHASAPACAAVCLPPPPTGAELSCAGVFQTVPGRLYLTYSNGTNGAAALDGVSVPMDYTGDGQSWSADCSTSPDLMGYSYKGTGGGNMFLSVCSGGGSSVIVNGHSLYQSCNPFGSAACVTLNGTVGVTSFSPFLATLTGIAVTADGTVCTGADGTIDITISE